MGPKAIELITQNSGHYAVQGHWRSPLSVPMEIDEMKVRWFKVRSKTD